MTRRNFAAPILFGLALICSPAFAQVAYIERALLDYIDDQDIDGAAFYANIDGKELQIAVGTVDEDQTVATQIDTRFYIASTGKMMTAAAILSLVEEGKLALDEPVWPHIKDINGIAALSNADQVTLRQLLNHTSGLAEYLGDEFGDASSQTPSKRWTATEALSFAFDLEPEFSPAMSFVYTNTNYVLLGHILDQFDGSMSASLAERVFNNAGMKNSTVGADPQDTTLAYGFDEDGNDASAQAWASILGDGPAVSTAKDVGKFMLALFKQNSLIGTTLLDQMRTGSEHDQDYGLGMGIDGDDWGDWYGHAGSYGGYEADVRYYPASNTVMVVLMNDNPIEEDAFLDQAAEIIFD